MRTHLLKGTGCKVRNESEYGIAVGIYMAAGGSIWPWHKGWQGLPEGEDYIVISWEPRGIMAQAGYPKPVFENILQLLQEFQRKVDTMCVVRVIPHGGDALYLARGVGKNEPFVLTSRYSDAWYMDMACAEQTMKSLEEYSKKRDLFRDLVVVPLMWVEEYGY